MIARDDRLDDALARGAEDRGFSVLRLALLATEAGGDGGRFLAWLAHPPAGAAVAWTSRRAGEAIAAAALPRHWAALGALPLFAVGDESAAPIRGAGLTVTTPPDGSAGAKRLAAVITRGGEGELGAEDGSGSTRLGGGAGPGSTRPGGGAPAPTIRRVAFPHGDRALPDLPDALRSAGIEVEWFELQRTRALSPDLGAVERAAAAGRPMAVAYFSPSGVESLERLLRPETTALLRRDALALARGETTRAALLARGYRRSSHPGPTEAFDAFALEALQSSLRTTP